MSTSSKIWSSQVLVRKKETHFNIYTLHTIDEYSICEPIPNDSVDSTDSRYSSSEGSDEEEVTLDEGSRSSSGSGLFHVGNDTDESEETDSLPFDPLPYHHQLVLPVPYRESEIL